jgi:hypothetical protein
MPHATNESANGGANGHFDSTMSGNVSNDHVALCSGDTQFGSSGYSVPQDLTWMDPQNRKLRVLTIGAGISGILMAYQIQKQCENVEHVIYDKSSDIGGAITSHLTYDIILICDRHLAPEPLS